MMHKLFLAAALLQLLVACGADGEPTPPTNPGASVSGQVTVGVSGSL